MPQVSLNIPALVQQIKVENKTQYFLRPLFLEYPTASHPRFDQAVKFFRKELDHVLRGITFDQNQASLLLWYQFQPNYNYYRFKYSFTINKKFTEGKFAVITFKLKGITFAMLPGFNNYLFMVGIGVDKLEVKTKAEQNIERLLRQHRKVAGQQFDAKVFMAPKKEFVTNVKHNTHFENPPLKFDQQNIFSFFQSMMPNTDFNGAIEIEKVGYPLNEKYPDELQRAYFMENEVMQLVQRLSGNQNNPLILVGPEGVGKHTLIQEAIFRIMEEGKPNNPQVWHIDPTRVISGMSIVGQWEKRFEAIIKYVLKPHPSRPYPDKILIDNPVALLHIGKSAQNSLTLSKVLKPYLEKRAFHLLLIATPEEWKLMQEKERSFTDLFQVMRIQPCNIDIAAKITLQKRRDLELENNCEITIKAIQQLFTIRRNFLRKKAMPGSILRTLRQMAVKHRNGIVDAAAIREEFKDISGLKERIFDESYTFEENEIEDWISQELVGQPKAVEALCDAIHTIKAKLTNRDKPFASFLFIGPTGVGKTQAAKVLCKYLMGDEKHLLRFDMNEYIDELAPQRLIGDYFNPEGQLTGKVRYQPFGILLLDEIEKAHPKVLDLLLQVLDDGRLTDSRGRTVDFTNTIIIMTSNIGAKKVSSVAGFMTSNVNVLQIYQKAVETFFRPEFINRIAKLVVFKPLELNHILNIARLQIKELLKRDGFVRRTTILNISTEALEWVANRGFDKSMGGRALKRQIERDLTSLSANQLVKTHSETPILFEIILKDQKLSPQIHPLKFVEPLKSDWLPELPEEKHGRRFFGKLVHLLNRQEAQLRNLDDGGILSFDKKVSYKSKKEQERLRVYNFKSRLADIKDNIQDLMLGFSDNHFTLAPAIPFRLKQNSLIYKSGRNTNIDRIQLRDRLFQQEALQELRAQYEFSNTNFDSLRSEFLDQYINTAILLLKGNELLKKRFERISIQLDCFVSDMGQEQIQYLLEIYEDLLRFLKVNFALRKEERCINMEGYGLSILFAGEQGIHLFYRTHSNPIPIRFRIFSG
jgi:ATP-dependent Clp protease ATP-binding subunit ClpC